MCSHDWGKKNILGNLNKNTLKEIWLSEIATLSRKNLFHLTDLYHHAMYVM